MTDASLHSAKFASRALASTVTSRHLFWLRNWKVDAKAKWKLAAAPYKATNLFGPALDPVLVEDKDKRKVFPVAYRRPQRHYTPCSQRQPFRTNQASPSPRDLLFKGRTVPMTDSNFVTVPSTSLCQASLLWVRIQALSQGQMIVGLQVLLAVVSSYFTTSGCDLRLMSGFDVLLNEASPSSLSVAHHEGLYAAQFPLRRTRTCSCSRKFTISWRSGQ